MQSKRGVRQAAMRQAIHRSDWSRGIHFTKPWALILCGVFMCAQQSLAKPQAILFKQLIDGTGDIQKIPIIIVENAVITKIITNPADIPAGTNLIDLSRYTAIPGLIDAHAHITFAWDEHSKTSPWQFLRATPSPTLLFYARNNALKTLATGVTTLRDLSAKDYLNIQMRDLIANKQFKGPRILAAGYGLHPTSQVSKPGVSIPSGGRVDGVTEVMRAVREQIAAGADWIKLFGSTGSASDTSGIQTFTYAEIKAAVDLAHQMKKPVAFHSYGSAAVRDAVRAGVDSIEHAVGLDKETMQLMAEKNIVYVPTIDHNRYYIEHKDTFGYGPNTVKSLRDFIQRNLETTRQAHQLGVPIAMGSDAVFTMFGENTRELGWFVKAGMTPAEALSTATLNGALLLGMEDRLGQLKPGFSADIVAVEGNPLDDINAVIDGVRWVMKAGEIVIDKTEAQAKAKALDRVN